MLELNPQELYLYSSCLNAVYSHWGSFQPTIEENLQSFTSSEDEMREAVVRANLVYAVQYRARNVSEETKNVQRLLHAKLRTSLAAVHNIPTNVLVLDSLVLSNSATLGMRTSVIHSLNNVLSHYRSHWNNTNSDSLVYMFYRVNAFPIIIHKRQLESLFTAIVQQQRKEGNLGLCQCGLKRAADGVCSLCGYY